MCGSAACVISIGARTLMAKKRSQISGVSSAMRGRFISASGRSDETPMPALLITASIRPKRFAARRRRPGTPYVGEVRDQRIDVARRGAEPREAAGVAIDRRRRRARGDQRAA
jgi:hypothetical protein